MSQRLSLILVSLMVLLWQVSIEKDISIRHLHFKLLQPLPNNGHFNNTYPLLQLLPPEQSPATKIYVSYHSIQEFQPRIITQQDVDFDNKNTLLIAERILLRV